MGWNLTTGERHHVTLFGCGQGTFLGTRERAQGGPAQAGGPVPSRIWAECDPPN
jgi:hypothetical protein